MTGVLIAFEGGEGAGKTTQIRLLADRLGAAGLPVVVTRQPGGTPAGARIRTLLLDPRAGLDPTAETLLFAADRAQHVAEVVRPVLDRGDIVLTDRWVDSSLAYQAGGRGMDADQIRELSGWATGGLVPDLTVLLDLPPQVGLERAGRRGPADRMEAETLGFHERVRDAYLELAAADDRHLVVDARMPLWVIADEISERVWPLVTQARGNLL